METEPAPLLTMKRRRLSGVMAIGCGPAPVGICPAISSLAVSIATTPDSSATQRKWPSGWSATRPAPGPALMFLTTRQFDVSMAATSPGSGMLTNSNF